MKKVNMTIWMLATVIVTAASILYAVDNKTNRREFGDPSDSQSRQTQPMSRSGYQGAHQTSKALLCQADDLIGSQVRSSVNIRKNQYITDDEYGQNDNDNTGYNIEDDSAYNGQDELYQDTSADTVGTVEELILDDSQDRVCYVILNSDDQLHPVPWQAFDVRKSRQIDQNLTRSNEQTSTITERAYGTSESQDQTFRQKPALYLKLSKDQLRQAPSIESVSMDQLKDSQLKQQVDSFYSQHISKSISRKKSAQSQPFSTDQDQMDRTMTSRDSYQTQRQNEMTQSSDRYARATQKSQGNLLKASDVIGLDLESTGDGDLGSVEDLVIDAHQGQIAYALVSFGGFMNIGEKIAAVPWSSLSVEPQQQFARIEATQDQLNASVIEMDNIDKLSEPQFAQQIHSSFNAEPYWGVYGFVPGEDAESGTMQPWQAGSNFNQKFDPDKMSNIEGTIVSVGSFYPESGAAAGTKLQVKTDDGQIMTVYAGPEFFTSQKDITFESDKKVKVSGSKVTIDGQPVILASEIEVNGKTLRLRDRQGNPLWTSKQRSQEDQNRNENQKQKKMQQYQMEKQSQQKQY